MSFRCRHFDYFVFSLTAIIDISYFDIAMLLRFSPRFLHFFHPSDATPIFAPHARYAARRPLRAAAMRACATRRHDACRHCRCRHMPFSPRDATACILLRDAMLPLRDAFD
jgi:hypothetical protein